MDYLQSDEYVAYIQKNCGVRGYDHDEKSPSFTGPDIDIFLNYMKLMDIKKDDQVLEIGCGLGRLLKETFDAFGCKLYGIDKNQKMIELAKDRVSSICQELKTSRAERMDFSDNSFDKIFCWGSFELFEQEKAFLEMRRCLKEGGTLLLTGKSHTYHLDDIEAYSIEATVTEKVINHSFTNYQEMIRFANSIGMKPIHERFFERRGYFMKNKYSANKLEEFYEWLVIFKKIGIADKIIQNGISFSVPHSITYKKRND
jgi:ubiquinone/menaquinone biosynthesis C-methylase UbiE